MGVGIGFSGVLPVREYVELARQAEEAGADSIWVAERFCFRDSFTIATAVLGATRRIRVVPGPVSPYVRHPMALAMGAATMDDFAPGRVGLQIGTGNPRAQGEFGTAVVEPLATIRETAEVVRRLLGGDFVHFQGRRFRIDGAKMAFALAAPIPLYVAAMRPRMLALSGEVGDGVVLSAGISPAHAGHGAEAARKAAAAAGRDPKDLLVVGFITASVSHDRARAYDAARATLAYLFRTPAHRADWETTGISVDSEAIFAALKVRDWDRAKALVGDEAVRAYSATGTPVEFAGRLRAYQEAGIDLPVILPQGSPEDQLLAIRTAVEVAGCG